MDLQSDEVAEQIGTQVTELLSQISYTDDNVIPMLQRIVRFCDNNFERVRMDTSSSSSSNSDMDIDNAPPPNQNMQIDNAPPPDQERALLKKQAKKFKKIIRKDIPTAVKIKDDLELRSVILHYMLTKLQGFIEMRNAQRNNG